MHQYGLDLGSIEWLQAGVNQPGRVEKVKLKLPSGVKLTPVPGKSLSEMLVSGGNRRGSHRASAKLFPRRSSERPPSLRELRGSGKSYICETGIFPIMHIIAIR